MPPYHPKIVDIDGGQASQEINTDSALIGYSAIDDLVENQLLNNLCSLNNLDHLKYTDQKHSEGSA